MTHRLIAWSLLGALTALGLAPPVLAAPLAKQAAAESNTETDYQRYMRLGYTYTNQFDYNTALINFRRALEARPGDPLATEAIANVEFYLERNRLLRRQREIDRLEARLAQARDQQDWVCAAATVDQLVQYTEPDSANRQRLLGYRGELSGLMDARANLENWSTVCSPTAPLY